MVIKDSIAGHTAITLETNTAILSSGANSFTSTMDDGNYVNGPISFSSDFTKMRFAGVYKFSSLLANTVPSTVISPIPVFEIDLPVAEMAGLVSIAAMVLGAV